MYNYYDLIQAVNTLTSYISDNIFPLLLVLIFLNFSILTISILRWFKR